MPVLTTAAGSAVGYDTFGDPDAAPLVLIQGFSAQRLGWRPGFCQALADAGFHVIRFDNRDVGESERHPADGYGLAALADDTAAFLDALGLASAHIVGQSMGGLVAQIVATEHRDRVRSLGLVYTAASVRHFIGADDIVGRGATEPPATREEFVAAYVRDEATCASPGYPQDTAWLAELGAEMWDAGVDPAGVARQLDAVLAFTDRIAEARTITAPTAIVAGDGDRLIDWAASEELHTLIPDSTLRIFPGMGHELPAALWPQIVRILAGNAARAEATPAPALRI
jgi:pimeloyl-ACP methyl ester carboxylesterase